MASRRSNAASQLSASYRTGFPAVAGEPSGAAATREGQIKEATTKKRPIAPPKIVKKPANFASILAGHYAKIARARQMDNIIEARELQIERKHFYVELRENDRGKFLRITEEAHGRRNSIIVPSTGIDDFTATIAEVLTNGETAPA
jgi:hypothetical protein